jgi:uncharacterized protein YndB with AHSA1/START domain
VRPGGRIRIDIKGPNGNVYPMGGVFHKIVNHEELVFTSTAFEDEKGNAGHEVLNTVKFTEHNGKTEFTLRAKVVKATPEVEESLAGMEKGWHQSLDRLNDILI